MTKADKEKLGAKRAVQGAVLGGLFVVSFLLFIFLTFPYEVLKEEVAAQVSKATGMNVRIGDMSPALPLGIKADQVHVETPNNGSVALDLKSLRIRVGILNLFLGRLALDVEAKAGSGVLDVEPIFGILDLSQGKSVPKRFILSAKNFPLDGIANFALASAASSPTANPMVAPLLSAIGISAALNGEADFKLDAKNPASSTGQADIELANAVLKLSHPSLGLPDQRFKKAALKAKIESGSIVIDKSSAFIADELEVLADGKINLRPVIGASLLDVKVVVKLNKGLKDKFGFLIDAMTGSTTSEGKLTMQVRGQMDQPAVSTF